MAEERLKGGREMFETFQLMESEVLDDGSFKILLQETYLEFSGVTFFNIMMVNARRITFPEGGDQIVQEVRHGYTGETENKKRVYSVQDNALGVSPFRERKNAFGVVNT